MIAIKHGPLLLILLFLIVVCPLLLLLLLIRQPLNPPRLPDWAWERINQEIAPKRTVFRRILVRLLPQSGFIDPRWLPDSLEERVQAWNTWYLNEHSLNAYSYWAVIAVLGAFLSTIPPYSICLNYIGFIGISVKIVATFGLVAGVYYWRISTEYVKIKLAVWERQNFL